MIIEEADVDLCIPVMNRFASKIHGDCYFIKQLYFNHIISLWDNIMLNYFGNSLNINN
jgi:hypothetical protein